MNLAKKIFFYVAASPPLLLLSWVIEKVQLYFGVYMVIARKKRMFPDNPDLVFSSSTSFKYAERMKFGKRVIIGPHVTIGAFSGITLEDDVRISQGVMLETAGLDLSANLPYPHIGKPITIKKGAWIGAHAMVLAGVTVGEGAVIGAGAVVTKDVAPYAIIVGTPPRVLLNKHPGRSRH